MFLKKNIFVFFWCLLFILNFYLRKCGYFFIMFLIYMWSSILKMIVLNCFNGLIFKNIFKRVYDYIDCMLLSYIEIV